MYTLLLFVSLTNEVVYLIYLTWFIIIRKSTSLQLHLVYPLNAMLLFTIHNYLCYSFTSLINYSRFVQL